MARINFDDNVEAQPEFKRLVAKTGGWDDALGKLVRFFRLAQHAYGRGEGIPRETLEADDLGCMIESGWAIPNGDKFQAKGSDNHFAWYAQKVESAVSGGRARAAGPRDEKGRLLPASSRTLDNVQPEPSRNQPESSPLAPSLALSKRKECVSNNAVRACAETWSGTLTHFGASRPISQSEETQIARAIQAHGAELVDLALFGARFEKASENFNPKEHVSLGRVLLNDKGGKPRIDKFANLGARAKGGGQPAPGTSGRQSAVERAKAQLIAEADATAADFGKMPVTHD